MKQSRDFNHTINHLDAGLLVQKLAEMLGQVGIGVVANDKVGEINLNLKIKRVSETGQVNIEHRIKSTKPTPNGKVIEENTTQTAMYVHSTGAVTVTSESQNDIFETTT